MKKTIGPYKKVFCKYCSKCRNFISYDCRCFMGYTYEYNNYESWKVELNDDNRIKNRNNDCKDY